jgi:putative thioredoxin
MSGAVDLAAVKARSEAAARAAEAPPPAAGSYSATITEAEFQSEVIDRSFQVPVLLVLTSPRAPSAAQLVTSFENFVSRGRGALLLRTIEADSNPRIVTALQVQGVPAVFAVISGQLIPGFEGLLPDEQIAEFIGAVLQAAAQAGLAAPAPGAPEDAAAPDEPEAPEDPRFAAAEAALDAGDYEQATQRYQAILAQEPANEEAALALRQVQLLQRLEGVDQEAAARADAEPADVEAQLAAADLAFAGNEVEQALARLVRAVAATSGDDRERVRTRLLEYFDLLGPDDPRVPSARRELARALF